MFSHRFGMLEDDIGKISYLKADRKLYLVVIICLVIRLFMLFIATFDISNSIHPHCSWMAYKWYDLEQEIYCVSPSAADDSSAKLYNHGEGLY